MNQFYQNILIFKRIVSAGYVVTDEIANDIINECGKLAQKESKTRHDWVGKVIHWELCKRLKFDYSN